jgi:hypothetical protein
MVIGDLLAFDQQGIFRQRSSEPGRRRQGDGYRRYAHRRRGLAPTKAAIQPGEMGRVANHTVGLIAPAMLGDPFAPAIDLHGLQAHHHVHHLADEAVRHTVSNRVNI